MSSPVGVLDFFVVEANEYIERLDGLLGSAGPAGPDLEALARDARALRGSAMMARQQGIGTLAAAFERVVRALRGGTLRWDQATGGVLTATVDDFRILLRNVRSWGPNDDQRVQVRAAELNRLAPATPTPAGSAPARPSSPAAGNAFLGGETSELARVLDRFASAPGPETLMAVLERVRALRGVADVRDIPPLPGVMEAIENLLKALERRGPAGITAPQKTLVTAAAALLRRASRELTARGRIPSDLPELGPFEAALAALADDSGKADRIVPITQLFYDDHGPHILSAAPHPPTTPAERFRLEVVSLAEHLRLLVADARTATTPEHRERLGRELRNALRALGSTANSFGEKLVAHFAAEWSSHAREIDAAGLASLDEAAALLADPGIDAETLANGLRRLAPPYPARATPRPTPVVTSAVAAALTPDAAAQVSPSSRPPGAAVEPPAPSAAPQAPVATREPVRTPTGRELHALLQDGLAGLQELEERPLSPPARIPSEEIIPIEQLLYRGRSALQRAAELRQDLMRQGTTPSREAIQELFDLIDLALVDERA
jgi:chemotaxis protein histidine kinase CheA